MPRRIAILPDAVADQIAAGHHEIRPQPVDDGDRLPEHGARVHQEPAGPTGDQHRAGGFQLGLGVSCSFFTHGFQDFASLSFSHVLGFFQTQACELADRLNNLNLLRTGIFDDHIEFSLLFDRFGGCSLTNQSIEGFDPGSE